MNLLKVAVSSLLSLRALILALALVLLFIPTQPSLLQQLDQSLFRLGVTLSPIPQTSLPITIVELSPRELDGLVEDPSGASNFIGMAKRLAKSSATVGLVLERLPRQDLYAAENLLEKGALAQRDDREGEDSETKKKSSAISADRLVIASWQKLNRNREFINGWLHSKRVVTGLKTPAAPDQAISSSFVALEQKLDQDVSSKQNYFEYLPTYWQPRPKALPANTIAPNGTLHAWPAQVSNGIARSLVWQFDKATYADMSLALYQRYTNSKQLLWLENETLSLGSLRFPVSANGQVIPYYGAAGDTNLPVTFSTLSKVVKQLKANHGAFNKKILLVGAQGDPLLRDIAGTLLGLEHRAYYHSPFWMVWVDKVLLLVLAIYLLLVLPRLSIGTGILFSCLLAGVMLVVQLGWQITQSQWLPMGVFIQFLLLGHLVMGLWFRQRRHIQTWQQRYQLSSCQLGANLLRQERLDEALEAVVEAPNSEEVLSILYDIASQQERKRQYDGAQSTYRMIIKRKRGFKDASERLKKLASLNKPSVQNLGGDMSATKTLVLSEDLSNKPVLGRYEIERELGRGAMGVVYLGRDPRISRKVAIKTLNYNQFDAQQLPELKARFFREAEAAGRLGHPNIVTVYDVGEELDLAFIAMDYVEGNPLSHYTQPAGLLPLEKVYTIALNVAEALHYAHGKHIVHRDIKPSNILYSEDTGKVVVTDFGIARITDDSRTKTGDIMGSPLYMSPEQLKGKKVEEGADIYSLGITLYQLLTGALPFNGDNLANLTYQIIHEKHKNIRVLRPDLPASATRIINKSLQKDPAKRYASAQEMAEALRKSLEKDFSSTAERA